MKTKPLRVSPDPHAYLHSMPRVTIQLSVVQDHNFSMKLELKSQAGVIKTTPSEALFTP